MIMRKMFEDYEKKQKKKKRKVKPKKVPQNSNEDLDEKVKNFSWTYYFF